MAYAAKIENGIVVDVIAVPDNLDETESDQAIQAYLNGIGIGGTWIRTSFNANIRGKYAEGGDKYDADKDIFISPRDEFIPTLEEIEMYEINRYGKFSQ